MLLQGVLTPVSSSRLVHQIEADSTRAFAPSSPMELPPRLSRVSCGTLGSPRSARAFAPSAPMELLKRLSLMSCGTLGSPRSARAFAPSSPMELLER
eukprot:scaffold4866_cov149-Pinguiococcus_pyrenoidosus.AAC.1